MLRFVLLLFTTVGFSSARASSLQSYVSYHQQISVLVFSVMLLCCASLLHKLSHHKKTIALLSQERDLLAHCVSERSHELAELRTLFENAAQAAKIGVFDYDLVTGKLKWDASMFSIFGVSRDDFSAAYDAWRNAVLAEDLADTEAALQSAIRGDAPFNTDFRIRRGDGEIVTIHALGLVYRDSDGTPLRVVGVNQDVTAQEKKEVARMDAYSFTAQQPYEDAMPSEIVSTSSSVLTGRRVLLIEDNAINRELVMALLNQLGMIVECAEDGRQGVQQLACAVFDIVLMDIQMPEMDGITATRLIRADKRYAQLPIIAMTAHSLSDDYEKSLAAGMNDHLVKPIDVDKLTDTLRHWLIKTASTPANPTVVPAIEPSPTPQNNNLPAALPPFDIPAALLRTNNNPVLLHKLILMFHDNYAQTTASLHRMLHEADYVQAHRIAHSLKGVAGTLEARELYAAAAAVERAFHNNDTALAITPLIDALDARLSPALTAAASLADTPASARVVTSPTTRDTTIETITPLLAELHDHIVHNKLKARKLFIPIAEQLAGYGVDNELSALQARLEQLDFTGALPVLAQLITTLSATGA